MSNIVQLTREQELIENKPMIALRYRLLGMAAIDPRWYSAVRALEFAVEKHEGQMRKNGGKYIAHPVAATNYVLTLSGLINPVAAVAVTVMHDVGEDCGVSSQEFVDEFGSEIGDGVYAMSKVIDGRAKTLEEYAEGLARCKLASIAKPADRIHNQSTMHGAFSATKQLAYVEEATNLILPVIKRARRKFPQQEAAYENCKLVLRSQIDMVRNMVTVPEQAA